MEDFKTDKDLQQQLKDIFGLGIVDYVTGLAYKQRKLENLPTHIFLYVLGFLNISDILSLMRCSKIFFELCNKEVVWKLMFTKKFGRIPTKEENRLAVDYSWRELFKKRLAYVRKALSDSIEKQKKLIKNQVNPKRKNLKI